MVAVALLSTLDLLISHSLFGEDNGIIRNVSLVLSHFIDFAHSEGETCEMGESNWKFEILKMAGKYGVKITGKEGIEESVGEIRGEIEECDEN